MYYRESPGLGLAVAAIPVAAKAAGGIIGAVSSIFGGNPKDKGRLEANARYYAEASAPYCDPDATMALRGMSGRYGLLKGGKYCAGEGCGGWATAKAKDDANVKYNAASSSCVAAVAPGAAPSSNTLVVPSAVIPPASGYPQTLASVLPGVPSLAGLLSNPLALGVLGLSVYLMVKDR